MEEKTMKTLEKAKVYDDQYDGFSEIMQLTQEEKRELLDMWKETRII